MTQKTLRGQFNLAQREMRKGEDYKNASIFEKRAMDKSLEQQYKLVREENRQREIAAAQEAEAQRKKAEAAAIAQKIQSGDVKRQTIYKSGATSFPKDRPYSPEKNISQLLGSREYRQAGIQSKRRMAQNLAMGLPVGANPTRFEKLPSGDFRFIPSGFGGGWGGVGLNREPKSTGKIQQGPELGAAGSSGYDLYRKMMAEKAAKKSGGPQPAQSNIPASSMGITGSPLSLTGFGAMAGFSPRPTSPIEPPVQSPFSGGLSGFRFGGYGAIPQFPYSGY